MRRATYCTLKSIIPLGSILGVRELLKLISKILQNPRKCPLNSFYYRSTKFLVFLTSPSQEKMMNVLALGLVLTSLVTAGIFTPNPEKEIPKEAVIVKDGHRVVVVEYEKDDGNTKVSISSKDEKVYNGNDAKDKLSETMENVKERAKETSSSLGDRVEEIHNKFSPTELVCDAYGKCKRVIAGAMGKTKEAVAEKAHGAADRVQEVGEDAKGAVGESVGKVKEAATHASHKAFNQVQEAKENVMDSADEVSGKAKDNFAEKTGGIKDTMKEVPERTKRRVQDAIEATKKVKEEAERDARIKMEGNKEKVLEKAKEAEEWAENASDRAKKGAIRAKNEGQEELRGISRRARDAVVDGFAYAVSRERIASLAGVVNLMGFSAAYGMCAWVTFASSYVLAGALPRHQFAMVQSKIYPVYFKAMAYCVGMALLGHLTSYRKRSAGMLFQTFNLAASLVMTLVNLLYLEPLASKVMLKRMKKEKEEGREKEVKAGREPGTRVVDKDSTAEIAGRGGAIGGQVAEAETIRLTAALQRLNSYSSFLNVLTLMSLTGHLVHLGQRLYT